MTTVNLTSPELATLREMVWNAIDSLRTSGEDTADNPTFIFYCNLYAKLGGTPPTPDRDEEISPAAQQSAITLADDLIDIDRNGGTQDERS